MNTIVDTVQQDPKDLMSLKELCLKHGYNYPYLYKHSLLEGDITPYFRGVWKLSESEVKAFTDKVAQEKLAKIKNKKGDR